MKARRVAAAATIQAGAAAHGGRRQASVAALAVAAALALGAGGVAGCSFNDGPVPGAGPGGGSGGPSGPPIVYPGNNRPDGGFVTAEGDGGADAGCGRNLTGTLRDFKREHADFEEFTFIGDDRGMVTDKLGGDGKPVYAGNPKTPTTTGRGNFDQWFRDVAGVNQKAAVTLPFYESSPGVQTYENNAFFPVDGMLFGNQGNSHNYHFTYELHTQFLYRGGETFHFRGDDDVFTYINGTRVVDLGGIHLPQEATVNLDQEAARLGLVPGSYYDLAFFFAERHKEMSNFRIDTTIFFTACGIVID